VQSRPVLSRRVIEWGIVTLVLFALIWVLGREARVVQGQGERVAVKATLASLKAALAIDQLTAQMRAQKGTSTEKPKNPFTLMQGATPNYAGELTLRNIDSVPPGSWVFDPECGCVGYRLLYPQWLEPEQEADAIWFRVGATLADPRLKQQAQYRWFGQSMN
jgi:hypothetical protein